MTACLRMHRCCLCLDTAKGTILTAIACILAALTTFVLIVISLVYWDQFKEAVIQSYNNIGIIDEDTIAFILKVIWWGNIFSLIVAVFYIILCIFLIVGVAKETYKHMIPWISVTSMILPFFIVSFLIQLLLGIIGGGEPSVLVPALIVLIWCAIWAYGFFCAVSHYRMLKGDIHRPVATLFKRDDPERDYRET